MSIVQQFHRAGLDLRLARSPFASSADIFQLDIRRERPRDVRSEHFLAWLGSGENFVAVQGSDPKDRQLVLAVREGATSFEESVPSWIVWAANQQFSPGSVAWKRDIANRAGNGVKAADIVAVTGGASLVRSTKASTRHMLVGRDERQLFMCELPRPCTSVKQAHEALRTPIARSRSRSKLEQPLRQGEWFFIPISSEQAEKIDRAISSNRVVVRRKTSINSMIPRMGKPHIADEIVVLVDVGVGGARSEPHVFVRGAVRHVDHKTIHIRHWRRVVRNLEVDQGRSPLGGTWID